MVARNPEPSEALSAELDEEIAWMIPRNGRLYSRRLPGTELKPFESDMILAKPMDMTTFLRLLGRLEDDERESGE